MDLTSSETITTEAHVNKLCVYEMEKFQRDINGVCRLCLCVDENILFPATKLTDSTLTVDDIERFTGIRVIARESTPYALCIDCKNKLRKFNAYRSFCLRNDVKFRKLFAVVDVDAAEPTTDPVEPHIANDRCESPNGTIDEYNTMNMVIAETIEILEIEENSTGASEKHTQRSYVNMQEHSCDSISHADNDTYIEILNGNASLFKDTEMPDQRQVLITAANNDSTGETPNTEVRVKELCVLCGKLVVSIANHMLTHSTEHDIACEYCPKKYKSKSYLRQHVKYVHLKKILRTCKLCDRGFSYIDSYVAHMRAKHNFGVPFECKVCNLKFRHRGGLRNHTNRKHNIASNCECSICGMKFEDKKSLRDHGRVHSDEQPFACKYCPKRFKSPTSWKTHELTHKGVKFPCTLCDKIYAYKTLLNSHMRKEHGSEDSAHPGYT